MQYNHRRHLLTFILPLEGVDVNHWKRFYPVAMKKCVRFLASLLCFAVLISILTACGGEAAPVAGDTVSFTDALGRQVRIPEKPRRVAALLGSFADVWVLAGGDLCAAAEDAWTDFDLELPQAVNIGGAHSPNLELLFSADPDFVIASASTASNVQLRETLEAAGIAVAYFDVDNFADYLTMLDICTDITGRKDLYEKNGLQLQTQIEAIKADLRDKALPEDQRTVLLLRAHSGSVKAKGSQGTILGEMLSDLGCINIADSDTSLLENLSVESVIRQEPYRIFVVTMGNDTQKAMENLENMMLANPAWGSLTAVKEGRLHLMDRKLFNMKPNADWAVSYEKLCDILLEQQ
jgi:iron complex transport system substrate-binding protein